MINHTTPALVAIGLDLAWSARNNTGIVALIWGGTQASLIALWDARSDDEILRGLDSLTVEQTDVIIAIDAPLRVPNLEGRRVADAEMQRVFGKYHAGAYPTNRSLLATHHGEVRGEVIVRRLSTELNILHQSAIDPRQPIRQVFEAFPHPAMITLFGLNQVLKYKAKLNRTLETRLAAFRDYQRLIREKLGAIEPRLTIDTTLLDFLDERHLTTGSLAALKRYEDRLDALMCAYIALYYWYWGTERCRIFGSEAEGYIIAPIDDRTRDV